MCTFQGDRPSPFDRNMGTKMAAKCVGELIRQVQENKTAEGNFFFFNFLFFIHSQLQLHTQFQMIKNVSV